MADSIKMANVRKRKEALVALVEEYWTEHGFAPSRAELVTLSGLSAGTVRAYVQSLIEEGTLVEDPGKTRTLRVGF